ncbi:RNA recognition motif domain containing protein [Aphelenchoides avenae]|nr:RNA recognition motif domain containing protein [Aphelenchus avenae]
MSRGPIRVAWEAASRPSGRLLRVVDLAETADRKTLKEMFSRYGDLRCIEVEYDKSTGKSMRKAVLTFANRQEVQGVLDDFGGRFLRNGHGIISMTTGHLLRIGGLAGSVGRETLKTIFSRYGELRCVELEQDMATGKSEGKAFVTFADRGEVQAVLNDFGGVWLRNGEGAIMLPTDRLHRELERSLSAEAAPVSGASDSVSPSAAISDLRTDTVIHVTAHGDQANASMDFIDLSGPSTTSRLSAVDNESPAPARASAVVSPVEVGHSYAEKREYEIPVHFYAVSENVRNNTKVTLVARSSTELVAAMLRVDAAGVDCFSSEDPSIRDGRSFHPSELMSVNVTTAPTCSNMKYSQHVVFLSPVAMRDAMDLLMIQHTDVNLVAVLFDESADDQRSQVSQLLNVLR